MIEIMPESEGNILAIKATEKLTSSDYEKVLIPKLNEVIEQQGKARLVLYLPETFEGWELGAAWDDAKFGTKHMRDLDKIAVVGGPKWVQWGMSLGTHFMQGQIKTFPVSEIEPALEWVKE